MNRSGGNSVQQATCDDIRRLQPTAFRYARWLMWWDQEEAESAANLALFEAGRHVERTGIPLDALMRTFVHRRVVDHIRSDRGRHRKGASPPQRLTFPMDPHSIRGDPAKDGSPADILDVIDRAGLDPQQRLVVALTLEDWPQEHIGAVLGVTSSRVCQVLRTARDRLRPLLLDET